MILFDILLFFIELTFTACVNDVYFFKHNLVNLFKRTTPGHDLAAVP